MIHKAQKLTDEYYYQAFTPDSINNEKAYRLYDENGYFLEEFDTLQELINYVKLLTAVV